MRFLGRDLSLLSITVAKMIKATWRGKGFCGLHIPGHSSLWKTKAGTWRQEPKQKS